MLATWHHSDYHQGDFYYHPTLYLYKLCAQRVIASIKLFPTKTQQDTVAHSTPWPYYCARGYKFFGASNTLYAVLNTRLKTITVGWPSKCRFKIEGETLLVDNSAASSHNIIEKPRSNNEGAGHLRNNKLIFDPWSTLLYGPEDKDEKRHMDIAGPCWVSGADNNQCYTALFGDDNYDANYQTVSIRKLWIECDHRTGEQQVRYSLPQYGATKLIVAKPNNKKTSAKVVRWISHDGNFLLYRNISHEHCTHAPSSPKLCTRREFVLYKLSSLRTLLPNTVWNKHAIKKAFLALAVGAICTNLYHHYSSPHKASCFSQGSSYPTEVSHITRIPTSVRWPTYSAISLATLFHKRSGGR